MGCCRNFFGIFIPIVLMLVALASILTSTIFPWQFENQQIRRHHVSQSQPLIEDNSMSFFETVSELATSTAQEAFSTQSDVSSSYDIVNARFLLHGWKDGYCYFEEDYSPVYQLFNLQDCPAGSERNKKYDWYELESASYDLELIAIQDVNNNMFAIMIAACATGALTLLLGIVRICTAKRCVAAFYYIFAIVTVIILNVAFFYYYGKMPGLVRIAYDGSSVMSCEHSSDACNSVFGNYSMSYSDPLDITISYTRRVLFLSVGGIIAMSAALIMVVMALCSLCRTSPVQQAEAQPTEQYHLMHNQQNQQQQQQQQQQQPRQQNYNTVNYV